MTSVATIGLSMICLIFLCNSNGLTILTSPATNMLEKRRRDKEKEKNKGKGKGKEGEKRKEKEKKRKRRKGKDWRRKDSFRKIVVLPEKNK